MTRGAIEEMLARHKAAFAHRDIEALTAMHTADGTFDSPAYGLVRGRDAIRNGVGLRIVLNWTEELKRIIERGGIR